MKLISALIATLLLSAACHAETWPIAATDFATGQVVYYGRQELTPQGDAYQCLVKHSVEDLWLDVTGETIEFWPPFLWPGHPWVVSTSFFPATVVYPIPFPSCD